MEYKGKNALIIGAGISGVAAYDLLLKAGANPILYDANTALNVQDVRNRTCEKEKANVIIGELPRGVKESVDFVVLSPGVPTDTGLAWEFAQKGYYITGEIELAYSLSKGRLAAITGTNGKTTTTALTGEIVKNYQHAQKEEGSRNVRINEKRIGNCYVVGNIGIP